METAQEQLNHPTPPSPIHPPTTIHLKERRLSAGTIIGLTQDN